MQIQHRYIVVEGPIGVGKTSLTKKLGDSLGNELLLEKAEENPFIIRFYQNPRQYAYLFCCNEHSRYRVFVRSIYSSRL